jgi:signal transduction histidine kinase
MLLNLPARRKVTVAVDLFQEDEHNVVLKFSIKDTGIGISEDKIGSIFENFQQATSGTSRCMPVRV